MQKIAIIMGRGIEGCGVSKFTLEQMKWLQNNGYTVTTYAAIDKTWSRKNSHDTSNIIKIEFADSRSVDELIETCNTHDVIIINSLPSVSHSTEVVNGFKRILDSLKPPVVLIQHDHSSHSIKRNTLIDETLNVSKMCFVHSKSNPFSEYVQNTSALASLFQDAGPAMFEFQPGLDFDSVKSRYWKPIGETDPIMHKFIGRTTLWKGVIEMINFHNEYLRPNGYISTLEGLEKSIAIVNLEKRIEFNHCDKKHKNQCEVVELKPHQLAYVFGEYIHDALLRRMSKCGFGYQLSLLRPEFISRSIEYTHCEIAAVGAVPVFRKAYGDRCTHRQFGDKLTACKNTGTVWLDESNMGLAFDLITKLTRDHSMRDEYRHQAFEFYRAHQDAEHTFKEMHDKIHTHLFTVS